MTSQRTLPVLTITLLGAALAVGMTSCSRSPHREVVLEIPARTLWFDTGVDVTNKTIQIRYQSGTWSNDGAESNFCDGEGFIPEGTDFREVIPKLLVTNAPLGALVGRTNGGPFFVGNTYEDRPGEGRLFLSINDKPDSFDDNAGSLQITLTVLD